MPKAYDQRYYSPREQTRGRQPVGTPGGYQNYPAEPPPPPFAPAGTSVSGFRLGTPEQARYMRGQAEAMGFQFPTERPPGITMGATYSGQQLNPINSWQATPVGTGAQGATSTQRPGGSLWSDWGHAGQQVAPGTVQQDWFRDPSWGGHVVWNPQYGYQDYGDIEGRYSQAGAPVTQEQFGQWGLTPQFNPWQSYEQFAGRQTYGQQQAAQQGQGGFGGRMEASGLPTPWQWGVTGDVLGNIAQGGANIGIPDIWRQGAQGLGQMMEGGMPTDVSGIYGAQLPIAQRYLEETGKGLAEQFGMGGMRYSTPFQARLMEETGRMGENLALSQAQAQIGAQEAARGRMMGAYGQGLGYGGGMAGLEAGNIGRQMQAANQLWGQGMGEVMYPMNVAQGMAGLGQGMFNQQSQQINQMLNDPYLMAMLGMAGGTGFAQPQYQPSPFTTGLNVFGATYPWLQGQGQQQQNYYQGTDVPYQDYGLQF